MKGWDYKDDIIIDEIIKEEIIIRLSGSVTPNILLNNSDNLPLFRPTNFI